MGRAAFIPQQHAQRQLDRLLLDTWGRFVAQDVPALGATVEPGVYRAGSETGVGRGLVFICSVPSSWGCLVSVSIWCLECV